MSYNIASYQQIRIDRLSNNNIFLLDISKKTFDYFIKICGTTKNVYTVKISHKGFNKGKIYCDCPDGKKFYYQNVFCKHSCFVILKILKNLKDILVPSIFNVLMFSDDQLKLIVDELDKFNIDNYKQIIDNQLIDKYNNYSEPLFDVKQYNKEDDCLICFDTFCLTPVKICPTCNKIFHKKCISIWFNNSETRSCPHCRSHVWEHYGSPVTYNNLS